MPDNENIAKSANHKADDEIDLLELISVIWAGKWTIVAITCVFSVASVFYAVNQPNIYKSEALLAPVEQEQKLGGLQGQLGGLASFAGINLGGGSSSNTQLAIQILKSRQFSSKFIQKHNILPDLMAIDTWTMNDNSIVYNTDLYNPTDNEWVRKVDAPLVPKPSMQEAHKELSNLISVNVDLETKMVTLSVRHISPVIAQSWLVWLIEDINETMKTRDVAEANKSTAFLTSQLEETKISDIREILYKLVEEQAKTIMFANVRDEYIFRVIDPPLVPEAKAGPARALICILGAVLGGILSVVTVLIRYFTSK